MPCLLEALKIPEFYTGYQGSVFSGMEALMVLLAQIVLSQQMVQSSIHCWQTGG